MARRDRYLPPSRLREAPLNPNPTRPSSSILLEDRVEIQHREIQSLLADNQRLAVTHVALKEELTAAKREIQLLRETAAKVKAERDGQVREVYQKSLKKEAEARVIDVLVAELGQVRAAVKNLAAEREKIAAEMKVIEENLTEVKGDSDRAVAVKDETESLLIEIRKGRAAIDAEKKNRASNLHHKSIMEKNMDLLTREIEKLKTELVKAENRAGTSAAAAACPDPGYATNYGNPGMAYGATTCTEPHGRNQVHGNTGCLPQPVAGATQTASYSLQQSSVQ